MAGEPASKSTKAIEPDIQIIPAISDAGGPDPQPYAYPMQPDEEQQFRKKMLAMAADEIIARAKRLAGETMAPPPAHSAARRRAAKAAKTPQPVFEDVQLHVFDLATSNEPVLILTAKAHMPQARGKSPVDLEYMITLVARQDIYGDFLKAFANVTDSQHLDVSPRYEFIDAVDADGDGRGELLFRKVSSSGSAYTIFRVIGNQLWPLFDGRLGG